MNSVIFTVSDSAEPAYIILFQVLKIKILAFFFLPSPSCFHTSQKKASTCTFSRLDLMILSGLSFGLCISSVNTGPNVHYMLWSKPSSSPLANVTANHTGLKARSFVCRSFLRKLKNFLYLIFYFVPLRQARGECIPFVSEHVKTSVCFSIILSRKCHVGSSCSWCYLIKKRSRTKGRILRGIGGVQWDGMDRI